MNHFSQTFKERHRSAFRRKFQLQDITAGQPHRRHRDRNLRPGSPRQRLRGIDPSLRNRSFTSFRITFPLSFLGLCHSEHSEESKPTKNLSRSVGRTNLPLRSIPPLRFACGPPVHVVTGGHGFAPAHCREKVALAPAISPASPARTVVRN